MARLGRGLTTPAAVAVALALLVSSTVIISVAEAQGCNTTTCCCFSDLIQVTRSDPTDANLVLLRGAVAGRCSGQTQAELVCQLASGLCRNPFFSASKMANGNLAVVTCNQNVLEAACVSGDCLTSNATWPGIYGAPSGTGYFFCVLLVASIDVIV